MQHLPRRTIQLDATHTMCLVLQVHSIGDEVNSVVLRHSRLQLSTLHPKVRDLINEAVTWQGMTQGNKQLNFTIIIM